MGVNGVSDITARVGEGVGLTSGRLQGREPVEVAVMWGRRLGSTMSWRNLGVFGR